MQNGAVFWTEWKHLLQKRALPLADGFYDVHIVVRQILEILGDDRLFFQFLYLVKQMDQCLIDDFSVIHSSSPFRLFCPF